jgi:transposase
MDNKTIEILLGFSELSVTSVKMSKSCIEIDCHSKFEENICPSCLKKCKKVSSVTTRRVRDMSILGKEVSLNLESRQFHCGDCSRYFQEQFSFVKPSKTNTIRLEAYLYACLKTSSFKQVSVRENILWDVLQDLFERYSRQEIQSKLAYFPKRIGIDELAYRKGKKEYAVVIVDLDKGCVWEVLEDRNKESLKAYFLAKGEAFCAGVEVVSCDMWEGFSTMAKEIFSECISGDRPFSFFPTLPSSLRYYPQRVAKKRPSKRVF